MDETAKGFSTGGGDLLPWGTRFDAVVRDFEGTGHASRALPCTTAYGFATRYVELTAPRPDRPVMTAAYELSGTDRPPKAIFAQLVIRLGQPAKIERDELSPHAASPDHVVLHANWKPGDGGTVGLSLYGAPRPSDFGDGVGKLYVSWGDVEAAAAPWIAAWHAANEAVAKDAETPGAMKAFSVLYDVKTSDRRDPRRLANLCLASPELLDTPAPVARKLGDKGFALWSDATGARWHLSTANLSVVLGGPETREVRVANIQPARGGGSSTIDVGGWWVRCAWNSRAIEDAARALERIPGLTVSRTSGHDA